MGNAHRRRHRNQPGCVYCQVGPKEARRLGLYKNKNGHRHNPRRKRRQKRPVKR